MHDLMFVFQTSDFANKQEILLNRLRTVITALEHFEEVVGGAVWSGACMHKHVQRFNCFSELCSSQKTKSSLR